MGRTLGSQLCRRLMDKCGKTATDKHPRTKGSEPSPSTLFNTVRHKTSSDCLGQHHCGSQHKQTRWDSLGGTLCPLVETSHLVLKTPDNTQSKTHPRFTECHCRQPFQEEPNSTHGMVSVPSDFQTNHSTLGTPTYRPICN